MRHAKIVCTLGPATSSPERLRELVDAGMDVARMNLSHGTQTEHRTTYERIRQAAADCGRNVGVLADLQGPKIRLAEFAEGRETLAYGDTFTITTRDVEGTASICGTTYKGLAGDVAVGDMVLIDDGRVALQVEAVTDTDVTTRVTVGGPVSDHKGINLPGVAVSVPALSGKDEADLRFALSLGVDMVALSFVRTAEDITGVHAIMDDEGVHVPVVAKLEKPQAIDNLDGIIAAFDGFMVARGDLGVELPFEDVPLVQKRIVEAARRNAKPVIVATQMLESMISSPRPTRAEASDVANAVLDGADAVMLSGETSVGQYPIEAVASMARIVESTEDHGMNRISHYASEPHTRAGIVCAAAVEVAHRIEATYLVGFTESGDTALRLARTRPQTPMLAFTPIESTHRWLSLVWGVESFLVESVMHTDDMVAMVDLTLVELNRCRTGQQVVVVAGSPPGISGSTNALRIHRIGDAIAGAAPAYRAR